MELSMTGQEKGNLLIQVTTWGTSGRLGWGKQIITGGTSGRLCWVKQMITCQPNTVKPPHVVTCIKRLPFSCPVIESSI